MDDKAKKEMILIAVLTPVLLVLFWKNVVVPRMHHRSVPVDSPGARFPAAGPQPEKAKTWSPQERLDKIKEYRALQWKGNPFYQPGMPKKTDSVAKPPPKSSPQFNLAGIVWDGSEPYAIIDDELRRTGDWVKDFRVVEIKEDRVIMERDGETITLKLFVADY